MSKCYSYRQALSSKLSSSSTTNARAKFVHGFHNESVCWSKTNMQGTFCFHTGTAAAPLLWLSCLKWSHVHAISYNNKHEINADRMLVTSTYTETDLYTAQAVALRLQLYMHIRSKCCISDDHIKGVHFKVSPYIWRA